MLIGEASRRSGVPAKTLRFYEDVGLLDAPDRSTAGYREYDEDVLDRLAFIRSSQALGLSLGEIRSIIALRDQGEAPCGHVLEIVQRRASEIDQTIRNLEMLKSELARLVERARRLDPADCDPNRVCHLIGTS